MMSRPAALRPEQTYFVAASTSSLLHILMHLAHEVSGSGNFCSPEAA